MNTDSNRDPTILGRVWQDSVIRLTFGLALVVTVLLNVPYYIHHRSLALGMMAFAILGSLAVTLSFLLLLTAHRLLLQFILPLILAACGAAVYFLQELGVYVNENTLGLVFETNWGEASDLISPHFMSYVALGLALAFFFQRKVLQNSASSRLSRRLGFAASLFVLHFLTAIQTRALEVYDPPLGLLTNSYVYFREASRVSGLLHSRTDISAGVSFEEKADDELTVILVVGETVRPDHLHINGYPRPTTPQMDKLGVVSFPNVIACAANTRFAVPCLLTRGTRDDKRRPYEETSLISVFRRLGFDTWWISMQGKFWEAIVPDEYTVAATAAIAAEAEQILYLNPTGDINRRKGFDTEMLPVVDRALDAPNGKKMLVLHTAGAHFHYASRYPAESHTHYEPICKEQSPKRCDLVALNNTYDNAIHFVDDFMGQLIERVATKNALILYVSDHGESLGEGGKYLHHLGSDEPEQNRTAMLAWASPRFKESRPRQWRQLSNNATKKLAHDHVFHSLLDCVGVKIPGLDPTHSICREVKERSFDFPRNRLSIKL